MRRDGFGVDLGREVEGRAYSHVWVSVRGEGVGGRVKGGLGELDWGMGEGGVGVVQGFENPDFFFYVVRSGR